MVVVGWEIKENVGGGGFKYDILDIRIFVNATMYPTLQNNKNKIYCEIYTRRKNTMQPKRYILLKTLLPGVNN
jgi:hypothetical protein